MLKRLVILGLVLLFAGSATLGWVITEKRREQQQAAYYRSKYPDKSGTAMDEQGRIKTKTQLQQEQQVRLKADLDKLAGGESDARAMADFLYGENWQQELDRYKKQKERNELILNGSIVCICIGGAIFTGCLLLCTVRLLVGVSSHLGRLLTNVRKDRKHAGRADFSPVTGDGGASPPVHSDNRKAQSSSTPLSLCVSVPGDALQLQTSVAAQTKSKRQLKPLFNVNRHDCNLETQNSKLKTQNSAAEDRDPLNNTLIELTQQVAAIREYASTQQDRVQKLQEGYDWNIIRNFCLRVIRCIDNVENRMRERAGKNGEAVHLREIRDELLFAIESSGIEQFEPEINSDYRGQEKHIEAVKERESCDDPDLSGKIARVIRPGYQYFVDDKHVKIVRPAMVMLFG